MKRAAPATTHITALSLMSAALVLLAAAVPAAASAAGKVPTANPGFAWGSRVSGTYANVQTNDNTFMRVREGTFFFFFNFLDSTWAGWQAFTEAPREKVLDIRVELTGYQSDASESWYAQFYNYNTSAWDSTWYSLGSLPTSPKGTRTVSVGDAARARSFVSAAGAFQLRLANSGTAAGRWDFTNTNLYIDLLQAHFIYDLTPPVSGITAPADGALTNAHTYLVTGTSADPSPDASGVAAVSVVTDATGAWQPAVPGPGGSYDTWSYNWTIPAEGTYNIRSRARDAVGNVEAPGPGVNVTVDWTAPAVASTSPVDGKADAAVTTEVRAVFTEAHGMKAATINASTFTLKSGGTGVAGTVSYDPAAMTASFVPAAELSYGTTYTATLTAGITDEAGNPLASDYSWSFTTAPPPPSYIHASDPGWQTAGTWVLERYSQLPPPFTGSADLLVANDAGATASFAIPAGYTRLEVASSLYWTCGLVEVLLDDTPLCTVDLIRDDTVWGNVIYSTTALNPDTGHTLTLRATGTGGPGIVYFDGVPYDLSSLHFVNVQWLRYR